MAAIVADCIPRQADSRRSSKEGGLLMDAAQKIKALWGDVRKLAAMACAALAVVTGCASFSYNWQNPELTRG